MDGANFDLDASCTDLRAAHDFIDVNLDSVSPYITDIAFVVSTYKADQNQLNFGQASNAYIYIR